MIVNKEELEELQGVTQKKLQELSKTGSADFSEKFVLQNLDSNITLVLNSDKGELIELGSRDKIIKDALLEYRADIAKIHSEIAFAGELSFYASQSLVMLENMIQALPDDEINLKNNLAAEISLLEPSIKKMIAFAKNDKTLSKYRKKDLCQEINPDFKKPFLSVEENKAEAKKAAVKTSTKTASKAPAKKSSAKSTSVKKTAGKSSASASGKSSGAKAAGSKSSKTKK